MACPIFGGLGVSICLARAFLWQAQYSVKSPIMRVVKNASIVLAFVS